MASHTPDEVPTAVGGVSTDRRTGRTPAVGRVGQRVGPFLLEERLELHDAIGLYRASRPAGSRQPREVAIRIVEDARNDRAAAWVRHEYDILVRLNHPGIARAFGYYSSQVGVAMSVPPSVRLDHILAARRAGHITLDVATALDIVHEVAAILRHAHSVTGPDGPVCHGHLHPGTIGLHADGKVAVLGFGAAPTETPYGYRPPEQVMGAFVDARSDQWRLGALMVELLLGVPPYADLDDPVAAAAEGLVQPWLRRLERRYPEISRVVAKLLSPAAGSRYDNEGSLVRDLLEVARHHGGRPDRMVLLSRMRALEEAKARQQAKKEAARLQAEAAPEPVLPPVRSEHERELRPTPALPDPTPVARTAPEPEPEPEPEQVPAAGVVPLAAPPEPDAPTEQAGGRTAAKVFEPEADDDDDSLDGPDLDAVLGLGSGPEADPLADPLAPTPPRSPPALAVVDPAATPESVGVVWEEDDEDDVSHEDQLSLGLGRVSAPTGDGPALGPFSSALTGAAEPSAAIDDPLVALDPSQEVTEVMSGPSPAAERSPSSGPRPQKWFPSELAAMAAIGVAIIVAIVFMAWRFG